MAASPTTIVKDAITYPHSAFVDLVVLMASGRMVNAYWYIPFVFLLFLASPVFDRFIRLKPALRFGIVALALAVALWVHRPAENLNPFHSLLYFANIYMFGMLFCEYRDRIMAVVTRPLVVLALTCLILAIATVQAVVLNDTSNIERAAGDGWLPLGIDLMLIQKYVGFFLFCGVFAAVGPACVRAAVLHRQEQFRTLFRPRHRDRRDDAAAGVVVTAYRPRNGRSGALQRLRPQRQPGHRLDREETHRPLQPLRHRQLRLARTVRRHLPRRPVCVPPAQYPAQRKRGPKAPCQTVANQPDQAASVSPCASSASRRSRSPAPLAAVSRSTNSITAMAALSPARKPAFMMRR